MGGLILGALPGVSPTLSVALLVPFTFHMEPASGLILLGSVYMASVAGGAISAILINVPGAPANIATMLDGYPMAKSGRAQSALYTCFISSFIGGVFGMVIMILLTFPLAEFALRFRSAEIFWIAVLGLTVVAGLGSGSIVKALLAGAFGVWLSTVGPNPTTGEFRFIFHDVLTGGIDIIAALIGLFAIPQVFSLIEGFGGKRITFAAQSEKGILKDTFIRTIKMFRVLSIGSIVGSIIGLIPGVGGQVAGIVAYDQTKKLSKNPQDYGTGIPEGVAAAEAANNAMVGPSLVPLLTLSIPGSPTAAVLLGGLLIHGIFPGPDLFLLQGDIVHTFIGSLLLAQFVMLVFGLFLSRHSGWVMRVPDLYMAVSIIVLGVFGTFSINNNFNDVIVMLVIGIFMYTGSKFGFSPAPVVMGLILGRIAENSFLKGILLAEAGDGMFKFFFSSWISITIVALCVLSVAFGIFTTIKGEKKKNAADKRDVIGSIIIMISSIVLYKFALTVKDPLSAIFPGATLMIMVGLSIILIAQTLMKAFSGSGFKKVEGYLYPFWRIFGAMAMVLAYFSLINVFGFYVTSFLFYLVFSFAFFADREEFFKRLHVRIAIPALFVGVLYILFALLLKVSTPSGLLL
ncbi:MAG TPA: C4-dicarboxylate ABC transporter permease [Nitrospirae bacterium]|nr:C4-dicarboxylate ABC transporter permease [Nitrospirota bacterium]